MTRRLVASYLAITAMTLALLVVPFGVTFAGRERDRLTTSVERDAYALASIVEDDLAGGRRPSVDPVLKRYSGEGGRVVIVDRAGIAVVDSGNGEPARDFATRPEIGVALGGKLATGIRHSDTLRQDLLYVAVPVASGGDIYGAVRITYPTSTLDRRVHWTWVRLGGFSASVLLAVAAVGFALAREVTSPVRQLETAALRLSAGDLSARAPDRGGAPEVRALARTFNDTAEHLQRVIESQRRFVADASHQLRTPLTALRLRLETLEPAIAEDDLPKLDGALAETERLGQLVEALLVLARAEVAQDNAQPVDVGALARERIGHWEPAAAARDVRLEVSGPAHLWARAVPGAVEQMLDNLVSNAIAASPEGQRIRVQLRSQAGAAELHVIDSGPGLTDDQRTHAFERFWRASRAGGQGFGLGLAIVAELATASGGSARLDPGPGDLGLDACVALPTAAAGAAALAGDRPAHP